MNSEWRFIGRGFVIAALGAAASMMYIVGLSAVYVGKYWIAGSVFALGVIAGILFRSSLGSYLDALERREN